MYLECKAPFYGCYLSPSKKHLQGEYKDLSSLFLGTLLAPLLLSEKKLKVQIISTSLKETELLPWMNFLKENLEGTLEYRLLKSAKIPKAYQKGVSKAKTLLFPSVKLFRNRKTSKLRLEIGGTSTSTSLL